MLEKVRKTQIATTNGLDWVLLVSLNPIGPSMIIIVSYCCSYISYPYILLKDTYACVIMTFNSSIIRIYLIPQHSRRIDYDDLCR